MDKKVSIIIPAYNASDYLAEALDSAVTQTYKNIEIIIVNDGSIDDGRTERIALQYQTKYPEIVRYYYKENGGCASALNFGIEVMRGEWFSWLSHDDLYLPDRTQQLVSAAAENGLDPDSSVIACDFLQINSEGKLIFSPFRQTRGLLLPPAAFSETLLVKTFNGCGLLIPKSVLDKVGGFLEEYKHLLDRELWMRIAFAGVSYFVIEPSLVCNRVHAKQITVEQQASLRAEEAQLMESYRLRALKEDVDAGYIRALCNFCYKRKHYKLGKSLARDARLHGKLSMKDITVMKLYQVRGMIRRPIGKLYKRMIRISGR